MENVRGRRPWLPFASTAYAVPHPQVKTLEFRYLGDRSMEQSVVWPDRQQLVTRHVRVNVETYLFGQ